MADETADPASASNTLFDVEGADAPRIGVDAQYIKDLSFENPVGPGSSAAIQNNPQVTVEVSTSARTIGKDRYEVCLIIHGRAMHEDSALFIVELTYGAVISLANVPDDAVQPILLIEGARLLFPFARNIVADITRDGGFPPLFLQPIDFMQLFHEQHLSDEDSEDDSEADG
jgi:preprotein translocase subunit SecB